MFGWIKHFFFFLTFLTFDYIPANLVVASESIFSFILQSFFSALLFFIQSQKNLFYLIGGFFLLLFFLFLILKIFVKTTKFSKPEDYQKAKNFYKSIIFSLIFFIFFPLFFILILKVFASIFSIFKLSEKSITLFFFSIGFVSESSKEIFLDWVQNIDPLFLFNSLILKIVYYKDSTFGYILNWDSFNPFVALISLCSGLWILGISLIHLFKSFWKLVINYLYGAIPIFKYSLDGGVSFRIWLYSILNNFLSVLACLISFFSIFSILSFLSGNPFKLTYFSLWSFKMIILILLAIVYEESILTKLQNLLKFSPSNLNLTEKTNQPIVSNFTKKFVSHSLNPNPTYATSRLGKWFAKKTYK